MTGQLIVIEGPDGSGTTRHSQMLADTLRANGVDAILTAEPTDGSIGKEIRSMLNGANMPPPDAVQLLFCADRAQHVNELISPALEKGKVIICDRYALSTIVYGKTLGLDPEWLKEINSIFPKPDLTVITLPPLEVCMDRVGRRESQDHFENEFFMRRIYEGYQTIKDPSTIFVDTSGTKDDVAQTVYELVSEHLTPISRETIANI